jgi:MFS family permease
MTLPSYPAAPGTNGGWDPSYEWKVVTLMSLGMGLVGVDRFLIVPLMPVLVKELHLDYQDLGDITGALALAWGASALFAGNLADKIGFRAVIIPATILFSMLAGVTGLAIGVGSLIAIRVAMGLAEGAFVPASIIATIDAAKPSRHGFNVGIQQAMPALLGLGLTPLAVTLLLRIMGWRWIFLLVAIPGLIVAGLSAKVLRKPPARALDTHATVHDAKPHLWHHALRYHNVPLAVLAMLCWLSCNIVIAALFPSYLVDHLGLDMPQMGLVLSSLGFGGAIGSLTLPLLSDRVGRKPVMLLCVVGALAALMALASIGPDVPALFGLMMLVSGFVLSLMVLTIGPVSAEAVPADLMSTASGLVVGVGEVFGGGIAPSLAGFGAKHFGIGCALDLPILALGCGLVAVAFLKETAPRRARHQEANPSGLTRAQNWVGR